MNTGDIFPTSSSSKALVSVAKSSNRLLSRARRSFAISFLANALLPSSRGTAAALNVAEKLSTLAAAAATAALWVTVTEGRFACAGGKRDAGAGDTRRLWLGGRGANSRRKVLCVAKPSESAPSDTDDCLVSRLIKPASSSCVACFILSNFASYGLLTQGWVTLGPCVKTPPLYVSNKLW